SLAPFLLGGVTWYVLRRRSRHRRVRALFGILALTVLAAAYLSLYNPGGVINRFNEILKQQDESSEKRLLILRNAWNTFLEYPWVGIGLGGFAEVCSTTAPEGIYYWVRYAHCEPLQWLAETGIAGMALLLTVAGGMLHTVWRQFRDRAPWQERAPFAVATLLIVAACLVDFPLRCPALLFLFALYLGATLATDRTTAELEAETAPDLASLPATSSGGRRLVPAVALPVILVSTLIGFLPITVSLFRRGTAMATMEFQTRSFKQDHDSVALAAAAENLLENAGLEPYFSGHALAVLARTNNSPEDLVRWEPKIEAILAGSPCHDSLYYFLAVIASVHGDYAGAAEWNAKARACAATNRNVLRNIARLDWYLAAATTEQGLRAARLNRAQETTRWLLTANPEWAEEMANECRQLGLSLDDFLPALPASWDRSGPLCQICVDCDRPLTALDLTARNDLYARTEASSESAPSHGLTRWDLSVLTTTGQADAACERIARMYRETPPSSRPGLLADIRRLGWGVLSAAQWDHFAQQVENAVPGSMERYELGKVFLMMGELDRACQCWLTAYKQERRPNLALALAQLYISYRAGGLAADYANEAVELDEKNPDAWRLLAIIQLTNHDFLAAQKAFDRYTALAPDRAQADFQLHGKILIGLGQGPGKQGK
ncbi:MAG TPA: O-antigen ligase family protein, partial [Planctomycetota bacterium]|nr:O-antigen ligase family protein [Planctomycetota bacterium]